MRPAHHRKPSTSVVRVMAGLAAAAIAATGLTTLAVGQASAAAGCRVKYTVNQWNTGFTGNVEVTNLGDPITSGWTLEWDFPGNQRITQSWNGDYTQVGQHVTIKNPSWSGSLPTNGTATPGFNATYSGTNPAPTSFSLNGVVCTGSVPTTSPTVTPTPTPTPTATPTPTPTPTATPTPTPSVPSGKPGMYVSGRRLYDRCGEEVVLRGVNKMVYWTDLDGVPSYREIARTGANSVRIQWLTEGTAADLDVAITNAVAEKLIPMVELHDATGAWHKLGSLVDYWTRSDVAAVLRKHERYLMVNIGNEVGDASVTATQFRTGYQDAVTRMRAAGIHSPLVIDAQDWGKNIDMLQAEGPAILAADPDRNVVFSVHMWWPQAWGYSAQRVRDELTQSANQGLPLIVGEFGNKWDETPSGAIPYQTILDEAQRLGIGWLAWEWGPGNNPQTWLDMTSDSTYATLHDWGLEVAVTHPNSIQNTAVRPQSMITGSCSA